jgi:hypothetical protein
MYCHSILAETEGLLDITGGSPEGGVSWATVDDLRAAARGGRYSFPVLNEVSVWRR